jgi:hypothetical protein
LSFWLILSPQRRCLYLSNRIRAVELAVCLADCLAGGLVVTGR